MAGPSSAAPFQVQVLQNVRVPMRDGVELAADIYCPDALGRFPTLLERTPYHRTESGLIKTKSPEFFASRGYLVVIQDVRGRFESDGAWYPFVDDGWGRLRDGYDTVEWLARHPLSNGRVGTLGGSYSGMTQLLMAPTRPPHLAACFVRESASDLAQQWIYRGGAFELGFNLEWCLRHALTTLAKQREAVMAALDRKQSLYKEDPLPHLVAIADPHAWLRDCLSHPDKDEFYAPFDLEAQHSQMNTPMLHLSGWFDIFLNGTIVNFLGLRKHARTAKARRAQRVVIGPWMHGPSTGDPSFGQHVGEMDFGPQAVADLNEVMLPWFDYWLRDSGDVMSGPAVKYFLMRADKWCTADEWPPRDAKPVRLYLARGTGRSAQSLNNGRLAREKPSSQNAAEGYSYDPRDPLPSIGGNTLHSPQLPPGMPNPTAADYMLTAGPRDQASIEERCLTYTTEPLSKDMAVVGPVWLILYASSSAPDTDFIAKLCDVFPDGRSILVTDGILRARYRASRARPRLLERGKIYRLQIDLWSTAWQFQAGHRLRVSITSSCFPRYDRNPNTGNTLAECTDVRTANNRVHLGARHPSHLLFHVQ